MSRVFFTSDLHFGHKNLCANLRNMSPEESDELIIKNWNSTITKNDRVYILGDITLENHKNVVEYLKQLKGDIVIVGGNHDNLKCCQEITKCGIPILGVLEYKGFICTHVPIHPMELERYKGNIHGHLHLGNYALPDKYYNVNTEFHNYTPVAFEDIVKSFNLKNKQ